jgi:hypothetical protein
MLPGVLNNGSCADDEQPSKRASAPSIHPDYLTQRERLYEGLRKAGMPES